jgi:hypothetical protein
MPNLTPEYQPAPGQPAAAPAVAPEQRVHLPPQVPPEHIDEQLIEMRIYSHSSLFYWWPVWVTGYIMAGITWMNGTAYNIGDSPHELFAANSNVGILFFLVLFLVILITNVTVRGLASGIVILAIILVTVIMAWMDWWTPVLDALGHLRIHLNLGAYFWFSTLIFVSWALATFIFDRLHYWQIKPGQVTEEFVFGAGSRSYDTRGMVLEKFQNDIFKHWLLGLGAGDLHIQTQGAAPAHIDIPNVLFIGARIAEFQRLIAVRPDAFGGSAVR